MGNVTVQDLLPYGGTKKVTNKKVDFDTVLPYIILPVLLLISCISRTVTIIVMVVICMGVLYVYSRPKQKNRSQFFFSWTLSSGLYMILVFEFEVLLLLEVTQAEHLILILLVVCTCFCFYQVRAIADFELATGSSKGKEYSPVITSESYYCHICQIEVNERYFHSLWMNCCIIKQNYLHFLLGLIMGLLSLLFGANLGLTTVCQPSILFSNILMPADCTDVYFEFHLAICFVTSVYALCYAGALFLILMQQVFMFLPKYSGK